jgi:DNA polymerase III alpha subunit
MVDNFIDRKHGAKRFPTRTCSGSMILKPVLEPTWHHPVSGTGDADCQGAFGIRLGGADMLRRAMGKKKPERWPSSAAPLKKGEEKRR